MKLEEFEVVSEQDGKRWLDRLELYQLDGKILLKEQWGDSKPYGELWYETQRTPTKSLKEAFGAYTSGGFCGMNDVAALEEELGVGLEQIDRPC